MTHEKSINDLAFSPDGKYRVFITPPGVDTLGRRLRQLLESPRPLNPNWRKRVRVERTGDRIPAARRF